MAAAEKELQFESFLKKRKDTLKFAWSKYLFRLRNTTLSFYTSKEADETCLRGKYYIHLVQSVREVKATDSNYTFEIVMKNGKRKLLSADTAELRKIWIEYLWKSMQLPSPGRKNSSCTWHDLPSLEQRAEADELNKSDSRSELDDSTFEQLSSSSDALGEEQEFESCDSEEETTIYDYPKSKSEGECTKTGFEKSNEELEHFDPYNIPNLENTCTKANSEEKSNEEPEHFDLYDIPNPGNKLFTAKSEEKSNEEPEHFDLYDISNPENTLMTKSEEESNEEPEHFDPYDIPNMENRLIMTKSEEKSNEEPEHFDLYDISNPKNTLMTKSEEKSNEEPEHFDLYDVPTPGNILFTAKSEEKSNEEPEHIDLYDIPNLENILFKAKSGDATDDIGEQSSDSDSGPLDELQGVSNV